MPKTLAYFFIFGLLIGIFASSIAKAQAQPTSSSNGAGNGTSVQVPGAVQTALNPISPYFDVNPPSLDTNPWWVSVDLLLLVVGGLLGSGLLARILGEKGARTGDINDQ